MDSISINNNANSNNVRHEIATNNGAQGIEVDANQQNIVVVENANNLPANQQNIGDRPLEQREAMQQEQIPVVDIDALIERYQDLIECKNIGDGKYGLSIKNKNISNEKAQEVLEAFKDVNVTELSLNACRNLMQLDIQNLQNLKRLEVLSCINLTRLTIQNLQNLEHLEVFNCRNLMQLDIQNLQNLKHLEVFSCRNLMQLDIKNLQSLEILYVLDCSNLMQLDIKNLQNLEILHVLDCSNLMQLDIKNLQNLKRLAVKDCSGLHGELDMSGSSQLVFVYIKNCADDFVVVISLKCPLAPRVPSYDSHIRIKEQRSIEKLHGLFLSKEEDKKAAQNIIRLVREHKLVGDDKKMDCLNFLKSYCERYVNASEKEKARAAKKYMSALIGFSAFLDACEDAFATGLAKLKIELGLGELLNKCNTPEERRQVLFGVYTEEQIKRAINRFDEKYKGIKTKEDKEAMRDPLELQLALNIVLNVPHTEDMIYVPTAVNAARAVTNAYNANANELRDLVVPCETFLETHDGIMPMFLKQTKAKLGLDEDKAQSFEVPLKIVLTSMLRNGQKFNTFLLSEQDYWPYTTGAKIIDSNATINEAENIIKTMNPEALKIINVTKEDVENVKNFITINKDGIIKNREADVEQSKPISLSDVFDFAEFGEHDGTSEEEAQTVANVIKSMTTFDNDKIQEQAKLIVNLYSEANYEDKLAEHLQNALRSNEQQQVMNPLGNDA